MSHAAKCALVTQERGRFPVTLMCAALGISRSGYYAAQRRPPSPRAQEEAWLRAAIRLAFAKSRARYGAPRIYHVLRRAGVRTARKRIARLMQTDGLVARPRRAWVRTTQARGGDPIHTNRLARAFAPGRPNQVWASDITYIPTQEGQLYLSVVLDVGSRAIVGWSMRDDLAETGALDALRMALAHRRPPPGLLHHSDRGSQYTGAAYQGLLVTHGLTASMSRVGDCWDNAVVESFFSTLKHECLHTTPRSRATARAIIFDFIEIHYNRERLHSSLQYRPPLEYERQCRSA